MLVLSRKLNEQIVLPQLGITIQVLKIVGNTVKIGVAAPRDINVVRGEIAPHDEKPAERASEHIGRARKSNRILNRPAEPKPPLVVGAPTRQAHCTDARSKPSAVAPQPCAVVKGPVR